MNYIFLLIASWLIIFQSFGQKQPPKEDAPHRANYTWEEEPTLTDIVPEDPNTDYMYLRNFESVEFYDNENGQLIQIVLNHKRIKVFSDKGIEKHNKIYIPQYMESPYTQQKARVINSKGEVFELKEEDIKEGTDEDSGREYRYFAFDGVDINSEIEFIFVYARNPVLNGSLRDIQKTNDQRDILVEYIAPIRLKLDFKVYNSDDLRFELDTTLQTSDRKTRWYVETESMPGLKNERSSAHDAQLVYYGYKLSRNYATNKTDLFSYGELSKVVYSNIYERLDKGDMKFLTKLYKKSKIDKISDPHEKIRAIEDLVKLENNIVRGQLPDNITLEQLWDAKLLTPGMTTVVMANLFRLADIPHEIGLTCDRFTFKFDKEFELWAFADAEIFYFTEIDQFTTPKRFERLGKPDWNNIHNYGLFVQTMEIMGEKFGVGKMRFIPANQMEDAGDTLRVFIDFNETGLEEPVFDIYHTIHGYKAQYMQPYFDVIDDEEDKKELKEHLINFIDDEGEVLELTTENLTIKEYGKNPVRGTGKLKSDHFLSKAKDNYTFRVGELIGPQAEMYSEDERKLAVEEYFNRHYHRTIEFVVPDGFKVADLAPLAIHEYYDNDKGERIMEFKSDFEVKDNKVIVTIIEYYKEVYFPLEIFEDYRRVINAAADFNKVALIFQKV